METRCAALCGPVVVGEVNEARQTPRYPVSFAVAQTGFPAESASVAQAAFSVKAPHHNLTP
eukprot:scaffold11839_cov22-Tisochrysis_lutea.AAC.8